MSLLLSAATACGGREEDTVSDYSLYSPAVQALIDSKAPALLLIRQVAAVDQYWEEIYDFEDLHGPEPVGWFEETMPGGDPDLISVGSRRINEKPVLVDSLEIRGRYEFIRDSLFDQLAGMPFFRSVEMLDSLFGDSANVICLTPPARVRDQALVFIAEGCFERFALGGAYYFLERVEGEWEVRAVVPMHVN